MKATLVASLRPYHGVLSPAVLRLSLVYLLVQIYLLLER